MPARNRPSRRKLYRALNMVANERFTFTSIGNHVCPACYRGDHRQHVDTFVKGYNPRNATTCDCVLCTRITKVVT